MNKKKVYDDICAILDNPDNSNIFILQAKEFVSLLDRLPNDPQKIKAVEMLMTELHSRIWLSRAAGHEEKAANIRSSVQIRKDITIDLEIRQ